MDQSFDMAFWAEHLKMEEETQPRNQTALPLHVFDGP
jgi:hypothetical protein